MVCRRVLEEGCLDHDNAKWGENTKGYGEAPRPAFRVFAAFALSWSGAPRRGGRHGWGRLGPR